MFSSTSALFSSRESPSNRAKELALLPRAYRSSALTASHGQISLSGSRSMSQTAEKRLVMRKSM
jgi:hypothetical protein